MRPRVHWVLGFLAVSACALGTAAFLASRAGFFKDEQLRPDVLAGQAMIDGHIYVRLHAGIDNPREASRTHHCGFSATVVNQSPYDLVAAQVTIDDKTVGLPSLPSGHSIEVPLWSFAIPQEAPSCAAKAHAFQDVATQAQTSVCAMAQVKADYCRRLVRVTGDFDYPHLEADDWEAARAERIAATALRQGNVPVGAVLAIPDGSFFKLGFDRSDVQKSPAARALAAAQPPFDPDNSVDVNRLVVWGYYASMDGPVTVLAVHGDANGVADWYKVSLWVVPDNTPRYEVIAWVMRDDLDKARARSLEARRNPSN